MDGGGMKKPSYAIAIELRKQDEDLETRFQALPDLYKWEWLAFACNNNPHASLNYANRLIGNLS